MKQTFTFYPAWLLAAAMATFLLTGATSASASAKFEALLVWGTNDEKPPDEKTYKPVDAETLKKLESLGLKWKNYYVVRKIEFEAPKGDSGKVAISDKASLRVKVQADQKVEVTFYGKKGEECSRRTQTLRLGDMLVHGGNVPENATAWLITLVRLK